MSAEKNYETRDVAHADHNTGNLRWERIYWYYGRNRSGNYGRFPGGIVRETTVDSQGKKHGKHALGNVSRKVLTLPTRRGYAHNRNGLK